MRPAIREKKKKYLRLLEYPCASTNRHPLGSYRGLNQSESEGRTSNFVMMHFCYSQIRSEIAHVEEFQHAQHESPVYDRRELTIKACLHFRPVAVIKLSLLMGFILFWL